MEFKDLVDKLNKELVENISNIKDEEEKNDDEISINIYEFHGSLTGNVIRRWATEVMGLDLGLSTCHKIGKPNDKNVDS